MPDMRRWLTDAAIAASKEITSRDPADKRRYHFVPQMYLKRWLDGGTLALGRPGTDLPRSVPVLVVEFEQSRPSPRDRVRGPRSAEAGIDNPSAKTVPGERMN